MVRISVSTLALTASLALTACAGDREPDPMTTAADDGTTGDDMTTSDGDDVTPTSDSAADETSTSGAPTGEDETVGNETSGGLDVDALYDCEDPEVVLVPMMGPGFDPATGEFVGVPQDSYVAHTTQAVVGPETMDQFMAANDMVLAQLMQTEGMLGVGFAIEPACGFLRTMGLWESEQAMFAFVGSGAHLEAMTQASEISLSGRTTYWTLDETAMPLTWEMALAELDPVEPSPIYD